MCDTSLFRTWYFLALLDLYSSDLINYTISNYPVLSMVTIMLDKAFEKISDGTNLILHSDQGWRYRHKQHQCTLKEEYSAKYGAVKETAWIML